MSHTVPIVPPKFHVCPSCGSLDVKADWLPHGGQIYRCIDCELLTPFVIETDDLEDARRIGAQIEEDAQ